MHLTHSGGTAITGVATNNALILINGVLQAPGSNGNFTLSEPSGTQLSWTGSGLVTATRDPNGASIPVGGLIVSVGSTRGFGYQPLVSAGGTVGIGTSTGKVLFVGQLATLDLVIEQVFKLLSMLLFKLKVLVVQESFLLEQQQYLTDT